MADSGDARRAVLAALHEGGDRCRAEAASGVCAPVFGGIFAAFKARGYLRQRDEITPGYGMRELVTLTPRGVAALAVLRAGGCDREVLGGTMRRP